MSSPHHLTNESLDPSPFSSLQSPPYSPPTAAAPPTVSPSPSPVSPPFRDPRSPYFSSYLLPSFEPSVSLVNGVIVRSSAPPGVVRGTARSRWRCCQCLSSIIYGFCAATKLGCSNIRQVSGVFWVMVLAFLTLLLFGLISPQPIVVVLLVLTGWLISLALHEFGHAATAFMGGDHSVNQRGYLTLNIFSYVHPIQSLLIPVVMLVAGGIGLPGGAVLVQTSSLASRGWESGVSLAGPLSNVLSGAFYSLIYQAIRLARWRSTSFIPQSSQFGLALLIWFEVTAILINMIPLPPLDGWGAVTPWLSRDCFLKKLMRNPWNRRSVELVVMMLLYVFLSRIPGFFQMINLLTKYIYGVSSVDTSAGAQSFYSFFGLSSLD